MASIVNSDDTYRESLSALPVRRKSHGTFSGMYGSRSNNASPAAVTIAAAVVRGLPERPAIHPQAASAPMSSTTFRLGSNPAPINIANSGSAPKSKMSSVAPRTVHPASAATKSLPQTSSHSGMCDGMELAGVFMAPNVASSLGGAAGRELSRLRARMYCYGRHSWISDVPVSYRGDGGLRFGSIFARCCSRSACAGRRLQRWKSHPGLRRRISARAARSELRPTPNHGGRLVPR